MSAVYWVAFAACLLNVLIAAANRDGHSALGWFIAAMWQGAATLRLVS